jgi:hypothetical protein
VKDFKLIPSILKNIGFDSEMKIPTVESLVSKVLGSFQNYKFLEDWVKIPCFY